MTADGSDVVIIGGGIVGVAAAAFLAAAGASVTLVEREGLASSASGANSGVVQHPFDPVLASLYRETLGLYRELAAMDLGFRLGAEPAGLLYLSTDAGVVDDVDTALAAAFPDLGRSVLAGADLVAIEPALAGDLVACRVDIGYPVSPGASTYAYAGLAERRGVRVRLGRAAALSEARASAAGRPAAGTAVIVDGAPIAADAVLVAAGPWTPAVIDPTTRWRPIRARWGVVVEADIPAGPTHVLEEAEIGATIGTSDGPIDAESVDDEALVDFSLVPLAGMASVGSTFLAREPDPASWIEPLLLHGARFVPGLVDAPIRGTRACPRPQGLDGRPLIGAVPERPGLFVCAGHGSWGISTGPASARLVSDLILGRAVAIPAAVDAGRFGPPPPLPRTA